MNKNEFCKTNVVFLVSPGTYWKMCDTIPSVDDSPIFSRQYTVAPVHREDITKANDELLKNKIIKASQSPYNTPVWIFPKKAWFARKNKMENGFWFP